MEKTNVKWAFKNDYDFKIWKFTGAEYDKNTHIDDGQEQYTWAYLTESQLERAFMDEDFPEPGYGYIMLKEGKVRQINL